MPKKQILITGASSGIGLETARALAMQGYSIIMACRNLEKTSIVRKEFVEESHNNAIELIQVDLSSLASIKRFAREFYERFGYLDVLINNAGVFCDTARKTVEGYEMTMGVNYIGTYYLTELLLPALIDRDQSRILMVSSKAGLYGKLAFKDDFFERHPHGFKAYSASKLAQILYTIDLAERLRHSGTNVVAVHPGSVATGIWHGQSFMMKIMAVINSKLYDTPKQGAETSIYLSTVENINEYSGKLLEKNNQVIAYNRKCLDVKLRRTLMHLTVKTLEETGYKLDHIDV